MSDKEIIIGTDEDLYTIMYGTSIKESPETNNSTTNTFDGAIIQGSDKIAYNLEISKLRYEGVDMHMEISMKLEDMLTKKDDITIIDTIRPAGETPYQVIKRYHNCLVTDNNYEMKPEDHTVENLKFRAENRETEWKVEE